MTSYLKIFHERLPWWPSGLRLHAPRAGGPGLISGQGTRSHMPQLRLGTAKLKTNKQKKPKKQTSKRKTPKLKKKSLVDISFVHFQAMLWSFFPSLFSPSDPNLLTPGSAHPSFSQTSQSPLEVHSEHLNSILILVSQFLYPELINNNPKIKWFSGW